LWGRFSTCGGIASRLPAFAQLPALGRFEIGRRLKTQCRILFGAGESA